MANLTDGRPRLLKFREVAAILQITDKTCAASLSGRTAWPQGWSSVAYQGRSN
jgi:hypothetical protein